jgi:hypothetical protein
MSVFTNPSGRSAAEASAYTGALLELLGARDARDVLRSTASVLAGRVAVLSPEAVRVPEAPGKWSVVEVVQHLADSELVAGWRFRLVIAQDRPSITGYDQDRWAARLGYREADMNEALLQFAVLRRANLRVIDGLSPADLNRAGLHAERGEESVAHMLKMYAGHDLLHLRQIDRIAQTVGG